MAASDYFRTMFKSCYEESQCCEVVLPGVEEDDLEPIVNYFYTGSIIINGDNVGSLLSAASLLLLPRLSQGDLTHLIGGLGQLIHSGGLGGLGVAHVVLTCQDVRGCTLLVWPLNDVEFFDYQRKHRAIIKL